MRDAVPTSNRSGSLNALVRWSFSAFLFTIFLTKPAMMFRGLPITLPDLVFVLSASACVFSVAFGRRRLKWRSVYWLLLFYFLAMALSAVFSPEPGRSAVKLLEKSYTIALAVLALSVIEDRQDFQQAILAFLLGSAVAIAVGLTSLVLFYIDPDSWVLQHTTYHYGAVPVGNYPRLSSTFVSASMFCNYLNMSLVLGLVAERIGWISKKTFWCFFLSALVCAAFTISAGLGGIFLAVGVWLWMSFRSDKKIAADLSLGGGILAATALYLVTFAALSPYSDVPYLIRFPFSDTAILPSPRLLVWAEAFRTFFANFWTGHGLGLPTVQVLFQNTEGDYSMLGDAHNTFLNIAAESGISGLAAIVSITVISLKASLGSKQNTLLFGLGTAFLCAFVYQGLTGAFEDARHLWVLIGILFAAVENRVD